MATHSSIPAWRIQWAQGPGRLQSMGSKNESRHKGQTHAQTLYTTETYLTKSTAIFVLLTFATLISISILCFFWFSPWKTSPTYSYAFYNLVPTKQHLPFKILTFFFPPFTHFCNYTQISVAWMGVSRTCCSPSLEIPKGLFN